MKVLVVASNGRVGRLIVNNAQKKGFDVTGSGKGENLSEARNYIQKNALDFTKEEVSGFDAVIDCAGGWDEKTIKNIPDVMIHLANILKGTKTRLYVVGGAGSLFVNPERTITVDMGKEFPESWKPLSSAHGKGLAYLRQTKDLNWTYISPACNFVADGEETGTYKLGGENMILNSKGESTISYADYAIALVDVLESGKYNKERISVVSL